MFHDKKYLEIVDDILHKNKTTNFMKDIFNWLPQKFNKEGNLLSPKEEDVSYVYNIYYGKFARKEYFNEMNDNIKVGDKIKIPYSDEFKNKYGKVVSICKTSVTLDFDGRVGIYNRSKENEWLIDKN